jgi:hypothetical protein
VSGALSSTDRFNATHSSKSGAKLFVITAMRVMALILTISDLSKLIALGNEYCLDNLNYASQRRILHVARRPRRGDVQLDRYEWDEP